MRRIPAVTAPAVSKRVAAEVAALKMGDVADFGNFMGAVIDSASYANLSGAIAEAKQGPGTKILVGGSCDDKTGYFIQPTVAVCDDPRHRLMKEELFGPLIAVHVYPERDVDATVALVDQTTPYSLTGAIFAQDRRVIEQLSHALRYAAGNFYINDKPTGAVVGQQPFGGARASGTNDKAGSIFNLTRWVNARAIKELFVPPTDYRYPHMG